MKIEIDKDDVRIRNKMTEIRRSKKDKLYNNYFNNCSEDEEIFVIEGKSTIVFWDNDRGVTRAYFCSTDREELLIMLRAIPDDCIVEYITRNKSDEILELLSLVMNPLFEMHRMSSARLTEQEKLEIEEKNRIFKYLYQPEKVRVATMEDFEYIYAKLYEIFDIRESHLPTADELKEIIQNEWVAVYIENNIITGFHIFKVEKEHFYGYQIWNSTGPEGYYSLITETSKMFKEYLKKNNIEETKARPGYSWVNIKNKKSKRLIEFWGSKFDGLYDFVFEKNKILVT